MGFEQEGGGGGGGGGAGDLVGPAVSVAGEVMVFDGTTGKLAKAGVGSSTDSVVLGAGAAGILEDVVLGVDASSPHPGGDCVIIGFEAATTDGQCVVVGHGASSANGNAVVVGDSATELGIHGVVIGQNATASTQAVAVGQGSTAGTNGIALGYRSNGQGDNIALGIDATATVFSGSVCIGKGSSITAAEQVVFGSTGTPITDFQTGVQDNGAALSIRSSAQLVAAGTAATATTTGGLIPAGASLLSVSARVTTAVTTDGADTFDVGDSTDPDRYGAGIAGTLATTLTAANYTADPQGVWSASAREIILAAPADAAFTAGAVRVVAHYTLPTAPTS